MTGTAEGTARAFEGSSTLLEPLVTVTEVLQYDIVGVGLSILLYDRGNFTLGRKQLGRSSFVGIPLPFLLLIRYVTL